MPIQTEMTVDHSQENCSYKKATVYWTPEQCRLQNTLILAGCNLAECLEILLTLPGIEFWLRINNHSVEQLEDAVKNWWGMGDCWMEVFGEAKTKGLN